MDTKRILNNDPLNRRAMLKQSVSLVLCAGIARAGYAADAARTFSAEAARLITRYLESLAKPDGAYGWPEQPDSFLSVTHAVVGTYRALGTAVPRADAVAAFVRRGHPISGPSAETRVHATELKEFVAQQIETLRWLGESADEFKPAVGGWKRISTYPAYYERDQNPVMRQEVQPVFCRQLLGLPVTDLPAAFADYLTARRRADGTFNNTPAADGSGGHLVNTWFGLRAQRALGIAPEPKVADWISRCQMPGGGFTWCPSPTVGAVEDVSYTWVAVHALALLGRKPARLRECVGWLQSLWNDDGGFADRPGAASTALATFQALDALRLLDAPPGATRRAPALRRALPADLAAFTIQFQAPGTDSPAEAVELARVLRIHLWGAKNAKAGWLERAQTIARQRGVAVIFFQSNEEYGTRVQVPGLGSYSHVNDPLAPPGRPLAAWPRKEGPWDQFRAEKLEPLHQAGGRMLWQISDNEEFARLLLDESVRRGGYDAISTFHFHDLNMAWTMPCVMRYQHDIPLVALQDAHAAAWWWGDQLAGYRTVFLAREPTWEGWLEALGERRVVAVRRDAATRRQLRMLGGTAPVRRLIMDRAAQWQWWDDAGTALDRVPASVVVVRTEDEFEPGRPKSGTVLRIRTRRIRTHSGPNMGLAATPIVDCLAVLIDGREVPAEKHERRDAMGRLEDVFQLVSLNQLSAGEHAVELRLVEPATGTRSAFTHRFSL